MKVANDLIKVIAGAVLMMQALGCSESPLNIPAVEQKAIAPRIVNDTYVPEELPDEEEQVYLSITINTIGSDNAMKSAGNGIYSSPAVTTTLVDKNGNSYSATESVKELLMIRRKLVLPNVPDGVYEMKVTNAEGKSLLLEPSNNDFVKGQVTIAGGAVIKQKATRNSQSFSSFGVLYGTQAQCKMPVTGGDGQPYPPNKVFCSSLESPLVFDLRTSEQNSEGIKMSSPYGGVQFDILGKGTKSQMAWIDKRHMNRFGFLALPESDGSIAGIHNLFGNNTRGPDDDTAENGFLALAKYDENKDGYIDENDSIFGSLRIWTDTVRNGSADRGELQPLSKYGFTRISVRYINILEVDRFGNETRMWSAAYKKNGQLRAVFDVWFQVLPSE